MKSYLLIIVTLAFTILSAVVAANYYWTIRRNITERGPRRPITTGYQIFFQQVALLAAILLFGWIGGFTLSDIGASASVHPLPAFALGVLVYFAILGVIEFSAYLLGIRERLHDLSFETMRAIWPRERNEKFVALIAVCLLNPFTEEVVYRGVLVYYFGSFIDNLLLAAAIAFVLSLAAHLYQGTWSLPFQALFHGAAILLILSPLGLFACIGLHFAGDLIPVAMLRKSMIEWRDRRRKRRKREGL